MSDLSAPIAVRRSLIRARQKSEDARSAIIRYEYRLPLGNLPSWSRLPGGALWQSFPLYSAPIRALL